MPAFSLRLPDLRNRLIRQEETIIFALIERAQFRLNPVIYQPGAIPVPGFAGSFGDFLLLETERLHAKVRRYTSPDEHPFFPDLPAPILPLLQFPPVIRPNTINHNAAIKRVYLEQVLPLICEAGDCSNYGSSATCDVAALQALSKRIHYGKFIAEAKRQAEPVRYAALQRAGDRAGLLEALTDPAVEAGLLRRVKLKGATYGQEIEATSTGATYKIPPQVIADVYAQWIIPLTKAVEVEYLLQCGGE